TPPTAAASRGPAVLTPAPSLSRKPLRSPAAPVSRAAPRATPVAARGDLPSPLPMKAARVPAPRTPAARRPAAVARTAAAPATRVPAAHVPAGAAHPLGAGEVPRPPAWVEPH